MGNKVLKANKKQGEHHLSETSRKLTELGFTVKSILKTGNPAAEILKIERRLKPDFIVVGAKGMTKQHALTLGGVARKVARYATCSVLVVRTRV